MNADDIKLIKQYLSEAGYANAVGEVCAKAAIQCLDDGLVMNGEAYLTKAKLNFEEAALFLSRAERYVHLISKAKS